MHVADTTIFFAPHSGGVKRYLLAKHDHLRRLGIRHTLVVPGTRTTRAGGEIVTVRSLRLPHPAGYRVPVSIGEWRSMLERCEPDLIEAGDPYHGAWASVRAARNMDVPVVAFAHSDLGRLAGTLGGVLVRRVAYAYLRRVYADFDVVAAASRSTQRNLLRAGIERVVLQPLGVDDAVFHPSRKDPLLRARLCLPADARLLIFAGRMSSEKRVSVLLKAIARLGDPYHLLLVGGARTRRVSPRATVLPYEHDPARLARLLASADAFVHAGVQETFGLVLLEAMACGLPVVAVAQGAVAEIVPSTAGMLAEGDGPVALVEAIDALFARDLAALSASARAHASSRYGWSATFQAQLEQYRHLTRAHAPSTDDAGAVSAA